MSRLAGPSFGTDLPLWSAAPFVGILVAITMLELVAPRWFARLRNKALVVTVLAVPAALQMLIGYGVSGLHALNHSLTDYVSFIALLTALYVVAGGIQVRGSLAGTTFGNTAMIGIGGLLANLIGTTGAAMVMVRPFLRANGERRRQSHLLVFFIIVVANCGGLLTPLGDPPLYLGFLRGVPFFWTLQLWLPWLLVNGLVLAMFVIVDRRMLARDERDNPTEPLLEELEEHEPVRIGGLRNVAFLGGIVAVVLASGSGLGTGGAAWPVWLQVGLLGLLTVGSYVLTPRAVHAANQFSLRPMASVAIVFLGIFVAMTAPLLILNTHSEALGLHEQWQFFWASGGLSAVLDNAPTYLSFASVAAGQEGIPTDGAFLGELIGTDRGAGLLLAISVASVCMGSLTYVGNGPNLMVKEIAEHRGIRMPSFFAYAGSAVAVLGPILVLLTLLFFT